MRDAAHVPVMTEEIRELLAFEGPGWIVDATVGLGGHAKALLDASPEARLLGMDADSGSLKLAGKALAPYSERVTLVHSNYTNCRQAMRKYGIPAAKSLLLDLGLSSWQLSRPERGFSFGEPGPLDMRMDTTSGKTLAKILESIKKEELADAIRRYGEERAAGRIAGAILDGWKKGRITDTRGLAEEIVRVRGRARKSEKIHPATRTFQALRILVNDEIGCLEKFLAGAREILEPGGRMAVLTFHSLEDRTVKRWMAHQFASCRCPQELPVCRCEGAPLLRPLARGIPPGPAETEKNPRARSARLRAAERLR